MSVQPPDEITLSSNRKIASEQTAAKINLDVSVLGMGKGKCDCWCGRKVNKNSPVIYDKTTETFKAAKKTSNAEDQAATVKFIEDIILKKCGGDEEKFNLICKAVKLDPKSSHFATINQIKKIKFLLED